MAKEIRFRVTDPSSQDVWRRVKGRGRNRRHCDRGLAFAKVRADSWTLRYPNQVLRPGIQVSTALGVGALTSAAPLLGAGTHYLQRQRSTPEALRATRSLTQRLRAAAELQSSPAGSKHTALAAPSAT